MRTLRLATVLVFTASLSACLARRAGSDVKIIGGVPSTEHPAVGILAKNGEMFCTATLISPRRAVTAAHCVLPHDPARDRFRFHLGPTFESSRPLDVTKVVPHPRYDEDESNYDIAYVDLGQDAPEAPMDVVRRIDGSLVGRELLLVGYGRNVSPEHGPGGGSGIKRRATSKVVALNDTKIRAQREGVSSCNGDSGGPAFVSGSAGEWHIAGVVSCGDATCGSYGTYTRVDRFLAFLGLSDGPDFDQELTRCGEVTSSGVCEGDTLVKCSNDCFAATVERTACDARPQGRCHTQAARKAAICVDSSWQEIPFVLREVKIVDGKYDLSTPLSGDVFFDQETIAAAEPPHQQSDDQGEFRELLTAGEHKVAVRRWFSSSAISVSRPQPILVPRGEPREPIVIATGKTPVLIAATAEVKAGEALYVTGQGFLLGDWKRGYRMTRNGDSWTFADAWPMGINYKIVRAKDQGPELAIDGQVSWETGQNRVLFRPMVRDVVREEVRPKF
jgi:hypothetical protein